MSVFLTPASALALGPNAMIYPTGWNNNTVTRGDDNTFPTVNLPFSMTWNGTTYTNVNINMNGNATFGAPFTAYNPNSLLSATGQNIMAPFWADVDTRNTAIASPGGLCYYSDAASSTACTVNGHKAFVVTWQGVAPYNNQSTPLNYFQLVIVERADTGAGNFDFWFNYDQIDWDFPTASSTTYPHAGWAFSSGGTGYEIAGGGTSGSFLDSGPNALIDGTLNAAGQPGRYIFTVRGGQLPNVPPNIDLAFKNKTIEANYLNGYTGYNSSTDATITDGDGTFTSTRNPVAGTFLPMGSTVVTWTATDNDGGVTVATQTINVVDTTPPHLPTTFSPSHTPSTWSGVGTIIANWTTSTDIASLLGGYSYSFSQNAPALPDATTETVTTVAGVTATTTVDAENFDAATWPADWPVSPTATYVRLGATRSHSAANSAEIYTANNNTRRTGMFQKTFDLSDFATTNLSWWDNRSAFNNAGADYETVAYSTDGGATWTNAYTTSIVQAASGWTQRTASLPCTSSVTVRFAASVNGTAEWVDFDDVNITGYAPAPNRTTGAPGDGVWYFNVRAVDTRGNWNPTAASCGPFWIESFPPISSSNIPAGWVNTFPSVSITATDAGSGVAYTRYQYDGGAWANYTAPFAPGVDGTHTLNFYSADVAGHVETTRTATLRLDTSKPSTPTLVAASAVSTTSVEVTWTPSTDAQSGVAYYAVYRNGSLVGTTTAGPYTDTGRTPGSSYSYYVVAYSGAGLPSNNSSTVSVTMPSAEIWMSMSTDTVDMGGVNPGLASTITSATTVKVGGIGTVAYDFFCSATDFSNAATSSITPTMPISALSYTTNGWVTLGSQQFTQAPYKIDTSTGVKYIWQHDYRFNYVLAVPWAFDPGTYTTTVTYTVVSR